MRIIIHDLEEKDLSKLNLSKLDHIINSLECENSCIGCFSCWIKHPKVCCYNDEFSNLPNLIKDADEWLIISKSRYGCYSTSIKRVLERCIGYVLPYFCLREGMIHHELRYDKKLLFHTIFYGDINKQDERCLFDLTKANSINLASSYKIEYCKNIKEIKKCISC